MCGSCWAFSTTGALEGQHYRATNNLISLSEQNLIDCTRKYGNDACRGGWMDRAFKYIVENGGIDSENSYPYVGAPGRCKYQVKNRGATEKSFVDLPRSKSKIVFSDNFNAVCLITLFPILIELTLPGNFDDVDDETTLLEALATVGPISLAIDASSFSFQLYQNGVYYEPNCRNDTVDHAVSNHHNLYCSLNSFNGTFLPGRAMKRPSQIDTFNFLRSSYRTCLLLFFRGNFTLWFSYTVHIY